MFTTSLALAAFASLALAQTVTVTENVTVTVTQGATYSSGSVYYTTQTAATYTAPSASVSAAAANHTIQVGANKLLTFEPNNIKANPGDNVIFVFSPKNHTVTQSSFADPCKALGSSGGFLGFNSGFNPVAADTPSDQLPTFTLKINDTNTIWGYCRQTGHCQQGMVFAINEKPDATFAAFQSKARGLASSSAGTPGASGASGAGGATGSAGSTATAAGADSSGTTDSGAISTSINVGLTAVLAVFGGLFFAL